MQRSRKFSSYTKVLLIIVVAILVVACSTGTQSAKTSVDSAKLPFSLQTFGVENMSEINFKPAPTNIINGYFDTVNASDAVKVEVSKAKPIVLQGWAILPEERRLADMVVITRGNNNSVVAVAPVNLERADVASSLQNFTYEYSGWTVKINPSLLPLNKVVLQAWAYNFDQKEATQLRNSHKLVLLK